MKRQCFSRRVVIGWAVACACLTRNNPANAAQTEGSRSHHGMVLEPQWQRLQQRAEQAGELDLASFLHSLTYQARDDQHLAYIPLLQWPKPALKSTEIASELWQAAVDLAKQSATHCLALAREAATQKQGERAYRLLWQAHHFDPSHADIAKLVSADAMLREPKSQRGTRAIQDYRWQARSYWEVASEHFRVLTQGEPDKAKQLCVDLERALAVWRQILFPLWATDAGIADALVKGKPSLAPPSAPMRVVLFPDRQAYLQLLAPLVPGIERSTGYYAPRWNATFLYTDGQEEDATQFHELTHQFLQEGSRLRGSRTPGRDDGFWVVEGLATYAESIRWNAFYATLGGWDAPRLNTARYRWLQQQHQRELSEMVAINQTQVASIPDLAEWYTDAAAYVHYFLDQGDHDQRQSLFDYIESVYRRGGDSRWDRANVNAASIRSLLQVDDVKLKQLGANDHVENLCLGGTQVTTQGIKALGSLPKLRWLDLAGLPVDEKDLESLLGGTSVLEKLNLERTRVSDQLQGLLQGHVGLREVDLSSTRVSDLTIQALRANRQLEILWLTASAVTDNSIDVLAQMTQLRRVDLQLSRVSEAGIARLKQARPKLDVNPLQIQRTN